MNLLNRFKIKAGWLLLVAWPSVSLVGATMVSTSSDVSGMTNAIDHTDGAAREMLEAANALAGQAVAMHGEVGQLLATIRAA